MFFFTVGGDMKEKVRIGIIICDRYRRCAGGKCFRSLRSREGAFSRYNNMEVEIARVVISNMLWGK